MLKQKEFRPFSVYVSKEVIQQKLDEGYEEMAFSFEGSWPRKIYGRIAKMCVFFSKDGRIETYEHQEIDDISVIRALKPSRLYIRDNEHLKERLQRFKVNLGKKRDLVRVLEDVIGWEER